MNQARTALQLARILVLLFLLRATGLFTSDIAEGVTRIQMERVWGLWAGVSLVSVLFVAMMLVGRRRWHSWPVLGVEGVVAAVLAFVPPLQWVLWFKISDWTTMMVDGFVQPLAVAWLGVVVLRGFHQLRDADTASPRSSDGGSEASAVADDSGRVGSA